MTTSSPQTLFRLCVNKLAQPLICDANLRATIPAQDLLLKELQDHVVRQCQANLPTFEARIPVTENVSIYIPTIVYYRDLVQDAILNPRTNMSSRLIMGPNACVRGKWAQCTRMGTIIRGAHRMFTRTHSARVDGLGTFIVHPSRIVQFRITVSGEEMGFCEVGYSLRLREFSRMVYRQCSRFMGDVDDNEIRRMASSGRLVIMVFVSARPEFVPDYQTSREFILGVLGG